MPLHHLALEIGAKQVADEQRFWACLGYNPVGLPPRGYRHVVWLVNREERSAVHLLLITQPSVPEYAHVAFTVGDFDRRVKGLERFGFRVEKASDYFGNRRVYAESPAGHHVELLSGSPSLKALPTEV